MTCFFCNIAEAQITSAIGASKDVKIPARYKGGSNVYTISKVSSEMSLLKELYSWIWNKDLDRK